MNTAVPQQTAREEKKTLPAHKEKKNPEQLFRVTDLSPAEKKKLDDLLQKKKEAERFHQFFAKEVKKRPGEVMKILGINPDDVKKKSADESKEKFADDVIAWAGKHNVQQENFLGYLDTLVAKQKNVGTKIGIAEKLMEYLKLMGRSQEDPYEVVQSWIDAETKKQTTAKQNLNSAQMQNPNLRKQ